jgi:hypothetical protein
MAPGREGIRMPIEKRVGLRKGYNEAGFPTSKIMLEADQWLKTVQKIRRTGRVCKKGLYRFETFEEADQWMETMILSSIQEFQL